MRDSVTLTPSSPTLGQLPIVLEPVLVERIWGVNDLAPWNSSPIEQGPVGEIWLTSETCVAESGEAKGQSLATLTSAAPDLFGDPRREGFPLLIKLLFPREKLSVQVHPNDLEAQALGMPRGKTECWYVLSAEPGAQVAVGFEQPMSQNAVRAAIEDGTLESKLRMLPVKAGDMVFVDAGTVHAIGPGMVVLETQQYSDTTYRLWDYGRPRELHVEAGTAVTRAETAAGLVQPNQHGTYTRLIACPYFSVDRFELGSDEPRPLAMSDNLQILIALDDGCRVVAAEQPSTALPRGHAVLLPAAGVAYSLEAQAAAVVIRVMQP